MLPIAEWPVAPDQIDYLFLTHAHIDHIGRLPELVHNGFQGEILTTHATKALLIPMLEDAMSFSEWSTRQVRALQQTIDDLSWGFEYGQDFILKNGIQFTLGRAGHILGSCFICLKLEHPSYRLIFSGDLGAKGTPLLPEPDLPTGPCDLLVLESTYGDRLHEQRSERRRRLGAVLTHALADQGKVFIPAFALGRTQELLYELDRLFSDPEMQAEFPALQPPHNIPVYVDSPLGIEITRIYARLSSYWGKEAQHLQSLGDHPLTFARLYAVETHREHQALLTKPGPAIIIAGSGMCTGGRIVSHLKHGLADERNDVIFVGYQAPGTPGRDIITYSQKPDGYVYLDGERVFIRAGIHVLSGYSAHADQRELIEWVESMSHKPARIKLVHGEPVAQHALATLLLEKGYTVDQDSVH